jgi:hypothetical protein
MAIVQEKPMARCVTSDPLVQSHFVYAFRYGTGMHTIIAR